jgi:hypothetical protein
MFQWVLRQAIDACELAPARFVRFGEPRFMEREGRASMDVIIPYSVVPHAPYEPRALVHRRLAGAVTVVREIIEIDFILTPNGAEFPPERTPTP